MRLYLDSCAIIYSVEGGSVVRTAVKNAISGALPGGELITSRLSRLECRVKPLRDGNAALLGEYDLLFTGRELNIAEISAEIVERATELRAKYNFKTPDALHLATAIDAKSDAFLTGDNSLSRCTEIKVISVS